MAASPSRRSGSSRRAQLGLFTGYIVAGTGALLGAILLGLSLFGPPLFETPRTAARDVVAPANKAAAEVRAGGQSVFSAVQGYFRAGSQNARLKKEMELARIRLAEARAVKLENTRLKALVRLRESAVQPVAITRMIGSTASSPRRFGYIGAGREDGVRDGMPVRSARGIVGRVLEAGSDSARILLLTDTESLLPVRRVEGDVVAFAQGRGDGLLRVRLVNLGINPLKKGDVFVTSGSGGLFHPNVAVAIVDTIIDDGALARVIADPAATDYVAVQPMFQPKAVRAMQAPPPTPNPEAVATGISPAATTRPPPAPAASPEPDDPTTSDGAT